LQTREYNSSKSRILIVDDHPLVRRGVAEFINQQQDLHVCGEADSIPQALKAIVDCSPHLVVVDLSLDESNGMRLIEDIRNNFPEIAVLVLSMHDESIYAERCLKLGAKGYVMKKELPEIFLSAIRKVLQGSIHVSDKLGSKFLSKLFCDENVPLSSVAESLSNREFEIFQLLGDGLRTREIAERLNLSGKTIETHLDHIKKKLNLGKNSELFKLAVKWKINEFNQ